MRVVDGLSDVGKRRKAAASAVPNPTSIDHAATLITRQGWALVAISCLLYTFSFVDRLIFGLLTVDIGHDLQLTDTQIGLLIGTSFAVVYSIAGLPIGHYLDKANRKRIMTIGVLLWGGMTMISGFAPNFLTLAICRGGVAFGEAVLTPGVISLIADFFPRERRILPTAIYAAIASFMTIGGLLIGAAGYQIAQHLSPAVGMGAWRITLILAGMPTVVLGLVFARVVREPERGRFDDRSASGGTQDDARAFTMHLRHNGAFYGPLYIGTALAATFLFGMMTWTPTLLIRAYHVGAASAGYRFGLLGICVGLFGSAFWPRLAVVLGQRGHPAPVLLSLAWGAAISIPAAIIGPSLPSVGLLLGGMALIIFSGNSISSLMPIAIQTYGPPHLRARLMALLSLAQSLVGYGAGPILVATIARHWSNNGMALGYSLSATAVLATPATLLCYWLARRTMIKRPFA